MKGSFVAACDIATQVRSDSATRLTARRSDRLRHLDVPDILSTSLSNDNGSRARRIDPNRRYCVPWMKLLKELMRAASAQRTGLTRAQDRELRPEDLRSQRRQYTSARALPNVGGNVELAVTGEAARGRGL